jgi:hypothetical protein
MTAGSEGTPELTVLINWTDFKLRETLLENNASKKIVFYLTQNKVLDSLRNPYYITITRFHVIFYY